MNVSRIASVVVLICVASISEIAPVNADTTRTTAGAGTSQCSAFVREYAQDPQTTAWIYLSWAQGYLSAVNLQRARLGEASVNMLPVDFDLPQQIAFLRDYCSSLPDRHFDQAATEMYFELLAHHTAVSSRPSP